jgi:hypothetical protein
MKGFSNHEWINKCALFYFALDWPLAYQHWLTVKVGISVLVLGA